jgi:hypothetical protein
LGRLSVILQQVIISMTNPYKPPKLNGEQDETRDKTWMRDKSWIGRECFGWFILLLAAFYSLDTLISFIRRYYTELRL